MKHIDERSYEPGDVIFAEGDIGNEMFIVQEGAVAVTKRVAGGDVFLGAQERGDFFGEMALLHAEPRQGTCVALVATRLLAIRGGELLLRLRKDPTFALEMLQQMGARLKYLETEVVKLIEQGAASRQTLDKVVGKSEYSHYRATQ